MSYTPDAQRQSEIGIFGKRVTQYMPGAVRTGEATIHIKTKWGLEGFGFLTKEFRRRIRAAMRDSVPRIYDYADSIMPERTGRLKSSFSVALSGELLRLNWDASYAAFVDKGVPSHIKRAGSAGGGPYMSWPGKKSRPFKADKHPDKIIAKSVKHPGFPAQNFAWMITKRTQEIVREEIGKQLNNLRIG